MAMNGDEAIEGTLKERQQARKEYKHALNAGKMAYLLEQADPDGKFLKEWQRYKETNCLNVLHASLGNIRPGVCCRIPCRT